MRVGLLGQLARVAASASFAEYFLAALERRRVGGQIFVAARRVLEIVRLGGGDEEQCGARRLRFIRLPVGGILSSGRERNSR